MPHIGTDYAGPVTMSHKGHAYIEPNFLSAGRTGQVFASLPAAEGIDVLENGMFAKYDYAAGEVNRKTDNNCPWFLVFNEEKLYDERHQMHRDFAWTRADFYDKQLYPRLLAPVLGDVFTTNAVVDGEYSRGDVLGVDPVTGYLKKDESGFIKVASCYTMPDGQPGLKVQVVKNQPAV